MHFRTLFLKMNLAVGQKSNFPKILRFSLLHVKYGWKIAAWAGSVIFLFSPSNKATASFLSPDNTKKYKCQWGFGVGCEKGLTRSGHLSTPLNEKYPYSNEILCRCRPFGLFKQLFLMSSGLISCVLLEKWWRTGQDNYSILIFRYEKSIKIFWRKSEKNTF